MFVHLEPEFALTRPNFDAKCTNIARLSFMLPAVTLAVPSPELVSQPAVTILDLHRHRVGI